MRAGLVLSYFGIACLVILTTARPASAQACEWFPSSACPAPGQRGTTNYPCFDDQVKGDWNTMTYHLSSQASYAGRGTTPTSDIWCFDQELEARNRGFRAAVR
jgi:hypothetical protein